MLARMWRKGKPLILLVGMQAGIATLKNSMEVPQDVKDRAILRPSNCTTRYLPQRYTCSEKKGHLHPNVHSSNVHNSQTVEGATKPFNKWIKRMWYIYTMEYYSAIRKDEYLPFTSTWMEMEGIMLSEISPSEKDNYHMVSLILEYKK